MLFASSASLACSLLVPFRPLPCLLIASQEQLRESKVERKTKKSSSELAREVHRISARERGGEGASNVADSRKRRKKRRRKKEALIRLRLTSSSFASLSLFFVFLSISFLPLFSLSSSSSSSSSHALVEFKKTNRLPKTKNRDSLFSIFEKKLAVFAALFLFVLSFRPASSKDKNKSNDGSSPSAGLGLGPLARGDRCPRGRVVAAGDRGRAGE